MTYLLLAVAVITEVTAYNGIFMMKLIQLLHHKNNSIGTLALCICLQMCVRESSRQALMVCKMAHHVKPLNINTSANNLKHQMSILTSCALCRQSDWHFYDPEKSFLGSQCIRELENQKNSVKQYF